MRILFCNIAWMKYYNGILMMQPVKWWSWVKKMKMLLSVLTLQLIMIEILGYVSLNKQRQQKSIAYRKLEGITKEDNIAEDFQLYGLLKK